MRSCRCYINSSAVCMKLLSIKVRGTARHRGRYLPPRSNLKNSFPLLCSRKQDSPFCLRPLRPLLSCACVEAARRLIAISYGDRWEIRQIDKSQVLAHGQMRQISSLNFEMTDIGGGPGLSLRIGTPCGLAAYDVDQRRGGGLATGLPRTTARVVHPSRAEALVARAERDGTFSVEVEYAVKGGDLRFEMLYCHQSEGVTALAVSPLKPHHLAIGLSDGTVVIQRLYAGGDNCFPTLPPLFLNRMSHAPITALHFAAERVLLAGDGAGALHKMDYKEFHTDEQAAIRISTQCGRMRGAIHALLAEGGSIHAYLANNRALRWRTPLVN
jgi:hypothetical protein